jgi:hypothetical protein
MMVDEIIYYKDIIYLFLESTLKDNILREAHDATLIGNQGYLQTYQKVMEIF